MSRVISEAKMLFQQGEGLAVEFKSKQLIAHRFIVCPNPWIKALRMV
jgi:hypothetical protein